MGPHFPYSWPSPDVWKDIVRYDQVYCAMLNVELTSILEACVGYSN